MNNNLSEFQQILLRTFKYFHQFCREHGITYYAHGGTCLGAVRHQGFIPWDDDMDVLMKREDYDKFIALQSEYQRDGYEVAHIADGHHLIWLPFAKFYSTDATVWEQRKYPLICAPWIDVFPMDNESASDPHIQLNSQIYAAMWHYHKCMARHPWREIWANLQSERRGNGLIKIIKLMYYRPQRPYRYAQLQRLLRQAQLIEGGGVTGHTDGQRIVFMQRSGLKMSFNCRLRTA